MLPYLRPVNTSIPHNLYVEVYYALCCDNSSIKMYDPNKDEIFKRRIETPEYDATMVLCKDGDIAISIEYLDETKNDLMCLFRVQDFINDDSLSLIISNRRHGRPTKVLIQKKYMKKAIIDVLFLGRIQKECYYKNKPKMTSSQYGAQLHDVSIVCRDD